MKHQMKTSRSNMTSEIATQKRENESKQRKRKRELMKIEHTKRQKLEEELADTTVSTNVLSATDISCCIKQAKKFLQRTQDLSDPLKHKAIVCVICDRFIIGTETIHYLSTENIKIHRKRISVESYEKFYNTTLKPELRNQYLINDIALKELLLSPRSRKTGKGYSTCSCCFAAMSSKKKTQNHPPKFAIANGFVIGSFPTEIERNTDNGKKKKMKIHSSELTDLMKAMVAPIRPYGSIFSFTGGCQKCIRGNYQFFEMDQNRLGGVIHQLNKSGIGEHIYCVLCGRMTPDQKKIARQRSKVDTTLFIDIMNWFVKESGHQGFKDIKIPQECPQPLLVQDKDTINNTDNSSIPDIETSYESGTYFFSSAQDPSKATSVYGSPEKFALAMFQRSAPTLLAYGGTYANTTDAPVENILPFTFPFGMGGPKMKRRVPISLQLCIQYYLRLSLPQFMEGPTILVLNHIYNRQMSYLSGVMTCKTNVNGISLGQRLSTLSIQDLEKIKDNNTSDLNQETQGLLKAISTSCKAMGHTDEASKYARRNCFAMLDFFGLNSLFLTTTPDDECSFRVRLYANPNIWVSTPVPTSKLFQI